MNEIALTVLFKGIGMLSAIIGGIFIARWGYHLYKDGVGSNDDHAAFEVGPIKITTKSVGSVVMSTAFLWAYAGVLLSPNLDKDGDNYKVYSSQVSDVNFNKVELMAELPNQEVRDNTQELKAIFANTLLNAENTTTLITIDGEAAKITPNSIKLLTSDTGEVYFTTKATTNNKSATLAYEPKFNKDTVIFTPAGIGNTIE